MPYETTSTGMERMSTIISIFTLAIAVWIIICWRKMFNKAGLPGRGALIPVYREYLRLKLAKMKKRFRISLAIPFVRLITSLIFRFIGTTSTGSIIAIKSLINWILGLLSFGIIIIFIISYFHIAKNFGKGTGFAFGLRFLNPIFIGILAFGKSTYNAEAK